MYGVHEVGKDSSDLMSCPNSEHSTTERKSKTEFCTWERARSLQGRGTAIQRNMTMALSDLTRWRTPSNKSRCKQQPVSRRRRRKLRCGRATKSLHS